MKKNTVLLKSLAFATASVFALSCSSEAEETHEEVAETVAAAEWVSLFDGETFTNWKEYNQTEIGAGWSITDGMLVASATGTDGNNIGFGHSLITEKQYSNYTLELDYKITPTGNSGIIYQVVEDENLGEDYQSGIEFQLLDDEGSLTESLPSHQTAGNYDMFAPVDTKKLNPAGEWNSVKLVHNNGNVEHWLNGEKVLEFTIGGADWDTKKAESKWADAEAWGIAKSGHIGLQNHGDAISFKNIRIMEL